MKNKIFLLFGFFVFTHHIVFAQNGSYKSGKKDGVWNYYSGNKKVLLARHFYNAGVKTGIWEFYTIKGSLSWTYNFNTSAGNYILENTRDGFYAYQGADGSWMKKQPDKKTLWLGSEDQWNDFLVSNMKYPEEAVPARVPGKVEIRIYVDELGNATAYKLGNNVEVSLDKEALRVARLFKPEFIPAVNIGKTVKSIYVLKVSYKLADSR